MWGNVQEVSDVGADLPLSPGLLRALPCGGRIDEVLPYAEASMLSFWTAGCRESVMSQPGGGNDQQCLPSVEITVAERR